MEDIMYKYKTKDGQDYFVPGHGQTVGGEITTDHIIENHNYELVESPQDPAQSQQPAAAHADGVVSQAQQLPPAAPQVAPTESESIQ